MLVYAGTPLAEDKEIIGQVTAVLHVRSRLEHTDFFVRLCDVEPSGKSLNVCDGILRLSPGQPAAMADGSLQIRIELWPTAYRFRKGHSLRVQVSSGAFPRWNCNPGTGAPAFTATEMQTVHQQVLHDPAHPSHLILPVAAG